MCILLAKEATEENSALKGLIYYPEKFDFWSHFFKVS